MANSSVVSMKALLEAGVHFGHQTRRWNPKMAPYIYTERNGIYIVDLQKTVRKLEEAYSFVRQLSESGQSLLFVGTKKQAQEAIREEATRCGQFYVNARWLGGMMTNFKTMRTRVDRLNQLKTMQEDGTFDMLPKKEVMKHLGEIAKLEKYLGGVKEMKKLPGALFIVDTRKERNAIAEAHKLGIPVVAIADTNCDPDEIDYVIPGNDDAIRAIKLISSIMANAVLEGKQGEQTAEAASEARIYQNCLEEFKMAFTAADVKNLREMTGVGMMDCKKALTASDGDMDKAVEWLREKGMAASAKKAGRIAAEGMAYAAVIDGVGVVVEVNAETDFVGKNEKFVDFVKGVAATVAKEAPADLDALMECKYVGTDLTVTQQQQEMVLVIGENIKVRRFARFAENVSVPYVHAGGKIGVLVNLESDLPAEKVEEIGKDVAMQIAALNPRFWDKSQVGQDVLDEEKKIMMVQMENDPKMASKPEAVREKIVMGKLNKFYSENCLLQQEFVKDNSMSVEQYIASAAKAAGGKVTFKDAIRFEKGEGIEKKQENFAEEIASMVKG